MFIVVSADFIVCSVLAVPYAQYAGGTMYSVMAVRCAMRLVNWWYEV
jgi:hypothetical protein